MTEQYLIFDIHGTLADIWPVERTVLLAMLGESYSERLDQFHAAYGDVYELYTVAIDGPPTTEQDFRVAYKARCEQLAVQGGLPEPPPLPTADFVASHATDYHFVFATGGILVEATHVLGSLGILELFDQESSTARDAEGPPERRAPKSSGLPLRWIAARHPTCALVTDSEADCRGAENAAIPSVLVGPDTRLTPEMVALAAPSKPDPASPGSVPFADRIEGSRFGDYDQLVGEREDVGYRPLLGESGGRHGWNMPSDSATEELLARVGGRALEIGCGDGSRFAIPALRAGVEVVALDVNAAHLDHIHSQAERSGFAGRLTTVLVPESWWEQEVWLDRVAEGVQGIDLLVARQVLQFGTVQTLVNVLRLADDVLSAAGELWMHNMSPYLQYLADLRWDRDQATAEGGHMIDAISSLNSALSDDPGLGPEDHARQIAKILAAIPLLHGFDQFLWFDDSLVRGALELSGRPLTVSESYYFSPERVWVRNKLLDGRREWRHRELHVARIGRRRM